MEFVKMQNLGNDFIFINEEISKEQIIKLCDRYFGIGADGVIVIKDNKMQIYNSDGSGASMCGNALLCLGVLDKDINEIETPSGLKRIERIENKIIVNMGQPMIMKGFPKKFHGIAINTINIGNLHVVAMVDDVDMFDLDYFAKTLQHYIRANVNIVSNVNKFSFRIRTFEYGAEETNACGSGVSSSFFVLYKLGLVNSRCEAICLGGNMEVYIDKDVYIKSSPKLVYKGVIEL
jgi:diaminopimelate epimerase